MRVNTKTEPAGVARPSICVVIMVKNESATIVRALESSRSLGKGADICWCVMDTGSTDNTVEILQSYAADNAQSFPGKICYGPFVDFSQARNLLYEQAKDQAEWLLLMDADQIWEDPLPLLSYLNDGTDGLFIPMSGVSRYWEIRLIRAGLPWQYTGRTHEILAPASERVFRVPVAITHIGDGGHKTNKYPRDLALLQLDVAEYPHNFYYWHRLGTTLQALKQYAEALAAFERVLELCAEQGQAEGEIAYWAEYGKGVSFAELGRRAESEEAWLRAAYMRPQRREALQTLLVSLNSRQAYEVTCQVATVFAGVEDVGAIERRGGQSTDIFQVFVDSWAVARVEWAGAAVLTGKKNLAQKLLAEVQSEGMPTHLQEPWERVTGLLNNKTASNPAK